MISFLFIDTERVWRGGQDQLFTLLRGLSRRGHAVHLACHPDTLMEKRSRELGLHIYPLLVRCEIGPAAFLKIASILSQVRPDILAFNTPRPILMGNLASRLSRVRARIIFRRVSFPLHKGWLTRIKYNWGIDCIIAISESIRGQLVTCGVPADRIRTVYEGIDLSLYPQRRYPGDNSAGEPVVIGTLAHMSPEKGLSHLVHAASLIPDVHKRMRFVLVGDGECRAALEQQVRETGLDTCFHFAGFQSRTAEYLRSFDIFVLPSLSEGLSSSILAAMATGLPVVATNVGGIPELITHGRNGALVAPADPLALAGEMEYLAQNLEERIRMGTEGRAIVEERFTLQRKIIETEELCATLLGKAERVSREAHA